MEKDKYGRRRFEPQDDTPVEWPLGISAPETLEQKIARMVRVGVSQRAAAAGFETFDEADDFDVEDPEEAPGSVHELDDDQEMIAKDHAMMRKIPKEAVQAYARDVARKRASAASKKGAGDPPSQNGAEPASGDSGKPAPAGKVS